MAFLARHAGAVSVKYHLNILAHVAEHAVLPVVPAALVSNAADEAYRCLSGSVAVLAYEFRVLPLPDPARFGRLAALVAATTNG